MNKKNSLPRQTVLEYLEFNTGNFISILINIDYCVFIY